tara:strand:- start:954 stop:1385 length:432 start_codon:yes stop_codon:yes gene_type:complete
MAIIDKNAKWYQIDEDEEVSIGITLPLNLSDVYSTKTTIDAVKQNLLNLCNTEAGERVMQPNLGTRLKRFIFEPFSEELIIQIQDVLMTGLTYWLPFIKINNIDVRMSEEAKGDFRNTLEISIDFSLVKDTSTTDSIQITIGA